MLDALPENHRIAATEAFRALDEIVQNSGRQPDRDPLEGATMEQRSLIVKLRDAFQIGQGNLGITAEQAIILFDFVPFEQQFHRTVLRTHVMANLKQYGLTL